MQLLGRLLVGVFIASLSLASAPISPRVIHESRIGSPVGWKPVRRALSSTVLPFRIGLAQSNMQSIEEYLLDVSHPESPNYGKHWSPAKVAETFRPSKDSVDTVREWLASNGIERHRVKLSASGGWLHVNVTVQEAEELLSTEYHVFESEEGLKHIACTEKYHLPEHVSKHVDLITPTLHFDVVEGEGHKFSKRSSAANPKGISAPAVDGTFETLFNGTDHCDTQITLDCLRTLYDFHYELVAPQKNSIGIIEYTPNLLIPSDLDVFFGNFSPSQVGERPKFFSIDGAPTPNGTSESAGESNLDLQYAMGLLGKKQVVSLLQVGDIYEGGSDNNLLDALDGSYCTFEGGDDPPEDGIYPDPNPAGYQGHDCGTVKPPFVTSTSYSFNEANLTPAYLERQCNEYAKLGLLGTTTLYSSGDKGVAGRNNICLEPNGTQALGAPIFSPSFPGTCPYILSVGATQVIPGNKVTDPESACQEVIFSGGGFSNVFAVPSWQESHVQNYLKKYPPPYASNIYNSTGRSRGYPDVSANGATYAVAVGGRFESVFGTSCSTPVTAAFITAINDARLAVGKSTVLSVALQCNWDSNATGKIPAVPSSQ